MSKSKSVLPRGELRGVDHADRGVDADRAHVLDKGRIDAHEHVVVDQHFERQPLALLVDDEARIGSRGFQPASAISRAGRQPLAPAACGRARVRPEPAARLFHRLAEDLGGKSLSRSGSSSASSSAPAGRSALNSEFSNSELRPLIGVVEQRLRWSIRSRSTGDRRAHAHVAEARRGAG
jgi:hypothetical protein